MSFVGVKQIRVGGDSTWEGRRERWTLFPEASGVPLTAAARDGSFDLFLTASAAVNDHFAAHRKKEKNLTVAQVWSRALQKVNYTPADHLSLTFHQRILYEQDSGAAMDGLSAEAEFWSDYTEFYPKGSTAGWERHGDGFVEGGYSEVVRRLAAGLDVRLSSPVSLVQHSAAGVALQGAAVLVTASIGALQAGQVTFQPPMPSHKAHALHRLGMGNVGKVFVKLRDGTDTGLLGNYSTGWVTESDRLITSCTRLEAEGRGRILECAVGGAAAVTAQRMQPDQLLQHTARELAPVLGSGAVEAVTATHWASEPYIRGAWSHVPPGGHADDFDILAEPIGKRLHFAGEGTCRLLYGNIHAAVVTGARSAHAILGLGFAGKVATSPAAAWPFFDPKLLHLCTQPPMDLGEDAAPAGFVM